MTLNLQPARKGRWKPGQSGNPAGSQRDRSLMELCRAHTEDAVKTLIVAMRNPRERVPAAIAILDRGWGKPEQRIHTQSEHTVLHLIAAQATQIIEAVTPETIEYDASEQPKE